MTACSTTEPGTGAAADAGSILDRIREEGSVNVGFANERPAAYRENGELVGADPAIHGYIFDQIGGIELEPHLFEFG